MTEGSGGPMSVVMEEYDEQLYNRQLYVMGHEAQKRLAASDVLIIGLDGLGVEVAKNIILAGVKSVTLHDPTPVTYMDLSSQFYVTEADLGKPKADASVGKLAELNQYVTVRVSSEALTEDFIKRFSVLFLSNASLNEQLRINDIAHAYGIRFIASEIRGVFGSVFCDFGDEFIVNDPNGEPGASCMIASITRENPGVVTVLDDHRHGLESGDVVVISEVEGMEEVNDKEYRVNVKGPYTFEIEDTTGFQDYIRGGYVNQIKQPVKMSFKPLREALVSPGEFVLADFAKMERPGTLHVAFRALHEYANQHGKLPTPGELGDAEELVKIAMSLNDSAQEGQFRADNLENEKDVILKLALTAVGNLSPMAALFGGIVGQEVLKACSGKFSPIRQYFYFDAVECLPDEPLPFEEIATTNSRYDGQIVVFGKTMQQMLSNLSYFLVGAGAIGCEMLKNWAMMGVGTGEAGAVHVTDMDRIEKSNLSRQFLFRPQDIGSAKSVVACRAAQAMNPALKVVAYENRVGGDTENIFNDDFYESLNGICNALDNIEARLYMDQRCLFYQLPLLESGTLGTKGSTQIVVPHLTENYGATRDPPEKGIPVCTLKNFPNQIEHTVQWARDWFEGVFKQAPDDVNQYLTNPGFIDVLKTQQNTKLETMKRIHECLVSARPGSYADCVVWARLRFEELFNNMIRQLLHNFPLEQLTKEGQPFWSGPKKPPTPIVFDHKDPLHFDFIKGVADLRASNYGIAPESSEQFFREIIPSIMVPDFSPVDGVKIAVTEQESKTESTSGIDVDAQFDNMLKSLPPPSSLQGFKMNGIEFDKDFDDQMAVIVAVSNLRARVYKIPEADLHKTRQIAGKIIPAIATTTALVTGLICLELYKLLQKKPVTAYKSASVNLAIPLFTFSEPNPPAVQNPVVKGEEWKWSAWDRIDIEGDLTLKEFLKYIEDQYGLSVSMVSHGVSILYSFFAAKKTVEQRMPMKLSEVVTQVTKKPLPEKKRYLILEIICMDKESSEDVEVPYVRMRIK